MESLQGLYHNLPSANPRAWGPAELSIVVPLTVHWVVALVYETFDAFGLFQRYRLLQPDEFSKNKVTKLEVVRGVLVNQAIRSIEDTKAIVQSPALTWLAYSAVTVARIFAALFVYDTWQFWVHLALHMRWAYKRIHLWHHLLNAPWSYAATYVHPFESFLLDALGPFVTCLIVGLTARERVAVFTLSVLKTLDDHSGYRFPWDPIILFGGMTGSDIVYHTVHHQSWGIKSNYALWFTFWDRAMGTIYKGPKSLNVTPQFAEFREVGKVAKTEHVE
ncbi:hypothetical protein RB597_010421 [Gaeumannomyces tritici]